MSDWLTPVAGFTLCGGLFVAIALSIGGFVGLAYAAILALADYPAWVSMASVAVCGVVGLVSAAVVARIDL